MADFYRKNHDLIQTKAEPLRISHPFPWSLLKRDIRNGKKQIGFKEQSEDRKTLLSRNQIALKLQNNTRLGKL